MIGTIGIMGIIAGGYVAIVCAVVSAAVTIGVSADAAVKQKLAQEKADGRQEKQIALDRSGSKKTRLRSRRAAATGTLAMIIEAKRNKHKTDATYRKLSRMQSTKSMLGQAKVNRSTYNYVTPVQS